MSQSNYDASKPEDKQHFMRCGGCGEWIDKRDLDEIFSHETDHEQHPDIPYAGSKKVGQVASPLTGELRIALLEGQIELHRDELDWWAAEMDFWRCKFLREHPELDNWDYALNARQRESERGF